jgi:hypothetical protein
MRRAESKVGRGRRRGGFPHVACIRGSLRTLPITTLRPPWLGKALAAVLPLLAAVPLLQLWDADLSVPLYGGGDVPFVRMLVHSIDEHGGFFENPRLGAPLGQELRDYPEVDALSFVLLRVLTLVFSDPDFALNAFYLLTFPLIGLSAYAVLRARAGTGPAVVAAVIYAFLPYHLERGESHLFLAAYWAVPFACHLMLVLLTGDTAFERRPGGRALLGWASRRTLLTLGACLVVGSTWFYYAADALLLLVAAGVVGAVARPARRTLAPAAVVVGATTLVLAVNVAPYVAHRLAEGANTEYVARAPEESEIFALKLMQLALPVEDHRIDRLGRFSRHYERTAPLQQRDESRATHLGAVGALGLAWLLIVAAAALLPGGGRAGLRRYGPAAAGALIALLFATVGGLGSLVGYTLTAQLRAWNRLSVFIAFFALLAVALAYDGFRERLRTSGRRLAFGAGLAALLAIGLLDQTSPSDVPDHATLARADKRDAGYVQSVERRLPAGAMVFQLPYMSFPEAVPKPGFPFYDQLRGYLHSDRLRWSFGDVTGRPSEWRDDLQGEPAAEVAEAVAAVGFDGIEVSRRGYGDRAAGLEAELRRLLGVRPLVGVGVDVAFYDLRPFARRLRERLGADALARLRESVLRSGLDRR